MYYLKKMENCVLILTKHNHHSEPMSANVHLDSHMWAPILTRNPNDIDKVHVVTTDKNNLEQFLVALKN